jgi:phospholipid/cholesterol/gamma-HCH transport system ATP-binding protein
MKSERIEPSWNSDESIPVKAPDAAEIIIEVRGLGNQFGSQIVHENLALNVRRGEVLAIIGGSGSGKSLLLRSIIGLQKPNSGEVKVLGVDMLKATPVEQAKVARHWGVMFQDGALFSTLTVLENIQLPIIEHQPLPVPLMQALARLKIALVGLGVDAAYKVPSQLSGGMRKRVGVARALALDPEILFLDEPSSGLDPIGAAELDSLLVTLKRSLDLTVVLITHDLDSIYACCDRVAVLADKQVIAIDTPARIAENPHPWIQACFAGPRGRNAASASASASASEKSETLPVAAANKVAVSENEKQGK